MNIWNTHNTEGNLCVLTLIQVSGQLEYENLPVIQKNIIIFSILKKRVSAISEYHASRRIVKTVSGKIDIDLELFEIFDKKKIFSNLQQYIFQTLLP